MGERGGDHVNGLGDLGEGTLYSRRDLGIFRVDDASDFQRGFAIEIGGGGVGLLRGQAGRGALHAVRSPRISLSGLRKADRSLPC